MNDTPLKHVIPSRGKFPTFHNTNGESFFKLVLSLDNDSFAFRMNDLLKKLVSGKAFSIKEDLQRIIKDSISKIA
jgi:hypothetical protein